MQSDGKTALFSCTVKGADGANTDGTGCSLFSATGKFEASKDFNIES